jgi:1,2-dihydroxy-3-keto-5-methylthiopentene dioxygenase
MATVRIPAENVTLTDTRAVDSYLASRGIDHERWTIDTDLPPDATPEAVLAAYSREVESLKHRGGYVTADVIDVKPDTPNLDAMLERFKTEHTHDEDEVRFIIKGRGIFHINSGGSGGSGGPGLAGGGPVFAVEVGPGDLIRVPRGTPHWFDLCAERRICAIRLFQNASGWTPQYTNSGVDRNFQPVCFGSAYIPPMETQGSRRL